MQGTKGSRGRIVKKSMVWSHHGKRTNTREIAILTNKGKRQRPKEPMVDAEDIATLWASRRKPHRRGK